MQAARLLRTGGDGVSGDYWKRLQIRSSPDSAYAVAQIVPALAHRDRSLL